MDPTNQRQHNQDASSSSSSSSYSSRSQGGVERTSSPASASSSMHLNAPPRYAAPHQPSVASPLRESTQSQHVSSGSGSEEATPTQSPGHSRVDLVSGSAASAMASRAQSYLGTWRDSATGWTQPSPNASHALPLHHSPQRQGNTDTSYFSLAPSDPSLMMHEATTGPTLSPSSSSRWTPTASVNATRNTLAPADADMRADGSVTDSRKHSFGSLHGVSGLTTQLGGVGGGMSGGTTGGAGIGSGGGGGYASSVDADFYSAPPSRLVSRTPTPVSHMSGIARVSSPEMAASSDSDDEDSDYYQGTPSGWGAALFGFGGGKTTNAGPTASRFARSDWKRDYHTLENRRGGAQWNDAEPDSMLDYASPRAKMRSSAKKLDQRSSLSTLASHSAPDVRRRNRRRRQRSSNVPLPLRVVTSLISKTFRTFFGPIHPLTIIIALFLIAGFVTSVTMLIIYILNPDKEPLPWRKHCQEQMPFPHAYADALAPVNVMVGIMTIDSKYERRNLIRNTYARHTLPTDAEGNSLANVQVKFVLGKVRKAHAARIALEMEAYNDIVVLDIDETQSAHKTHAYLRWAAENATVPFLRPVGSAKNDNVSLVDTFLPSANAPGRLTNYESSDRNRDATVSDDIRDADAEKMRYQVAWKKVDYVVKADDDSFIVLDELERHLRVAPRKMTYWGYLIKGWFMGGEAYALSFDLAQWIAHSVDTARTAKGKEDTRTPQWLAMHPDPSKINWVSEHCWIYDHPKAGSPYSHGYLFPDYVEKIKLEARRGLSEQEIAYRGGEHRSQSYSTVSKWHQKYVAPRRDLTAEEEVEALIEGGGRWGGAWVRGADGSTSETWVSYNDIVYQSDDARLRPSSTNAQGIAVLASDVGREPYSGLSIYGPVDRSGVVNGTASATAASKEGENEVSKTTGDMSTATVAITKDARRGVLDSISFLPRQLMGYRSTSPSSLSKGEMGQQHAAANGQVHANVVPPPYQTAVRSLPRPTPKDGYGEWASLRARRYLNRPHGGTVVVHYLKKTEWWLETALVLSGKPKLWTNGAGGLGKEWRMGGSPLIRSDGYISEGRSAPRRAAGHTAPADEGWDDKGDKASSLSLSDPSSLTFSSSEGKEAKHAAAIVINQNHAAENVAQDIDISFHHDDPTSSSYGAATGKDTHTSTGEPTPFSHVF